MGDGKVAVITGAAKGLGKGFTEALLKKGYKVYFCDINAEEGEKTRKEFADKYGEENIDFKSCDVANENNFKAYFEGVIQDSETINVMVNNAGILDEKHWRKCVDINLISLIQGTHLAIEHMKKSNGGKGGVILNMSSVAGFVPFSFSPVYCATKHAVIGFSISWADSPDVKDNGIRIVCLCPKAADTDILRNFGERVLSAQVFAGLMDEIELMKIDRVVEGFVKAIEDEGNNGKALLVSTELIDYYNIPSFEDSEIFRGK